MYMVCNVAVVPDPRVKGIPSLINPEESFVSASFRMTNIGGSKSESYGVGVFDASGKTYTDVQTSWRLNAADGSMQVAFENMKGAAEKTFLTGRLRAKTKRQAKKKRKWFLD